MNKIELKDKTKLITGVKGVQAFGNREACR